MAGHRRFLGIVSVAAVLCLGLDAIPATAQDHGLARIGFLLTGSPKSQGPYLRSLRQGLQELGHVEGRSVVVNPRFAMGKPDRLFELAEELIRLKSAVIVVVGATAAKVVREANSRVPVVVALAGDLVASGVVASLARPGGNTTGMTALSGELAGKKLQLLKEVIPGLSRVAVLHDDALPHNRSAANQISDAARMLGIGVQTLSVQAPGEFEGAFAAMARDGADALIVIVNRLNSVHAGTLVSLTQKRKMPTMCYRSSMVRAGCLVSYGADRLDIVRRSATHVHRILKGARPADLPVEQPSRFNLTVNLKTAKALGITIPRAVLLRADQVIE